MGSFPERHRNTLHKVLGVVPYLGIGAVLGGALCYNAGFENGVNSKEAAAAAAVVQPRLPGAIASCAIRQVVNNGDKTASISLSASPALEGRGDNGVVDISFTSGYSVGVQTERVNETSDGFGNYQIRYPVDIADGQITGARVEGQPCHGVILGSLGQVSLISQ